MSNTLSIDDYNQQRASLIAEDRGLRRDAISSKAATAAEREAEAIVRKIRADEDEKIWGAASETLPVSFPGMGFLSGKPVLEKTKLFKILLQMPKGALLHAHADATVDPKILLDIAHQMPSLYVRTTQPISSLTMQSCQPEYKALPSSDFTDVTTLCGESYEPGTWVQVKRARDNFDPVLGGPAGFDSWTINSITISAAEAYSKCNSLTAIWRKFDSTFLTSDGLIRYRPVWKEYLRQAFLTMAKDGISYMEPRMNFFSEFMFGEDGQENVPHREWLLDFQEALDDVKRRLTDQGLGDTFIGAKIIYSTVRFIPPERLEWALQDCLALKKEFPHLIAGFDLVGSENDLHPLKFYLDPLLKFKQQLVREGVDLPYIFHAGETFGDGTACDDNLYDAVLLGTKRIGHGFSITRHPKVMDLCRERGIAVEVCPISNEVLRLTSAMPMHPLPSMLNHGLTVALACDDPAVWGSSGLSHDFYQVLVSSEQTGLLTLKQFALDSIDVSMMDEEQKTLAHKVFSVSWDNFIHKIVSSQGLM